MKSFSMVLGCVALALTATQAKAIDYGDVNVQPVNFRGWLGGDEAGDCHDGHGGHDGAACASCNGCSTCEPLWNVYVGAVILDRSSPDGIPGVNYGWEAGVDVDLRSRLGNDYQLQVRYFGVNQWSDTFGNTLFTSNLHSTEVNLRRQWTDSLTLLGGFRWVEMSDFADDGVNLLDTRNHMYGGQIGAEWLVWDRGGPFTLTTGVKAGIYYNRAGYDALLLGTDRRSRTSHTAFLGEWDIIARYQLTDRWALRIGYQLLWLEGVSSVDVNQIIAAVTDDRVDTGGSPFYHGALVGAEFSY